VLPGIYCVTPDSLTIAQRELAGLLFAGDEACLTGLSALRRHGVRYLPASLSGLVHTTIPITRHRKSAGFVIVERTQRVPTPTMIDGMPSAPVARAVVDAGRRVISRRDTRAMVLETVQRRMTTVDQLAYELRKAQRRGTALLNETINEARAGVRSAPEAEVRDFLVRAPIPEPLWNPSLYLPDGSFLAEVDGLIVESMVAIEVDSREHHSVGDDWDDTVDRHTELTSSGLLVVHIVPSRFRANPRKYVERTVRAHQQGLGRRLPDIRVEPKGS
jgi:hypothetical protein